MIQTLLFLLGGSPAYPVCAAEFCAACGGAAAEIAILGQSRAGLEKYGAGILRPMREQGAARFTWIAPGAAGQMDWAAAAVRLRQASGIFICGGNTAAYHCLYVQSPLAGLIRERFFAGVPLAGVSAGALITMEQLRLTPDETGGEGLRLERGLGLVSGFVIAVHYSEQGLDSELREVMRRSGCRLGYGIDEAAVLICEDGKPARHLGGVHRVELDALSGV